MTPLHLIHAHLVLPDRELADASLLVQGGRISAIAPEVVPADARELDCDGAHLLPGLIDLHCDAIEKEIAPRPKVQFPLGFGIAQSDRRNAMAGVTTPYHAISFASDEFGVRNSATAAALARAIRGHRGLVDNRVHCRYEITDASGLDPLLELLDQGAMDLLSLMDHTPGQGQFKSIDAYVHYQMAQYKLAETEARAQAEAKLIGQASADGRVRTLVDRANRHGVPLASHDDDAPERVATMLAWGGRFSEFPINLPTARAAHAAGLSTILGAPNVVRGGSQSGSMRALDAVIAGVCDCLCSDYHPPSLIQAVFMLTELAGLSLPAAVALASANPARAAGLSDRGRIAVGQRADLIVVRREGPSVLVETTIVAGRVVMTTAGARSTAAATA